MVARKVRDGSPGRTPGRSAIKSDDLLVMASKYCTQYMCFGVDHHADTPYKQTTVLLAQREA